MKFNIKLKNKTISDKELLEDLQSVAKKLKKNKITRAQYDQFGKYSSTTLHNRFNTWRNALEKIGLEAGKAKNHVTDNELFKNLQNIWEYLGRQPRREEIKRNLSKFAGGTYERRFGSWNNSLVAFGEYINQQDNSLIEENKTNLSTG